MKPAIPDRPWPSWLRPSLDLLSRYAEVLAERGVDQGLLGPREVGRLWDRHLLNCAVIADPESGVIQSGASVADVGSGAGLPGLVWAITRPDLQVTLIEPLLRRATFLSEVVEDLGIGHRVVVLRDRAEDLASDGSWVPVDVVTARAVAPLPRLLQWTIPLMRPHGCLIAVKGQAAASEVASAASELDSHGIRHCSIETLTAAYVLEPTTVVIATRSAAE